MSQHTITTTTAAAASTAAATTTPAADCKAAPAAPAAPSDATADGAPQAVELTFEQGYDRLQQIAQRLGEEQVPVGEMCELFAEGRGLELALTEFLDGERARVEAIERGEGVRAFRISRTPGMEPSQAARSGAQPPGAESGGAQRASAAAHDELPF
jgi:exonuclease VII small subunit